MPRGTFILFEGIDHSGKSTHAKLLCDALNAKGITSELVRFPDRTTPVGNLIDQYLKGITDFDDRAFHLLCSANRWERAAWITERLESGVTLVVDRYTYSGVAYTMAKGIDYDWCMAPEAGLPKPDIVFYMTIPVGVFAHRRIGEARERYEKEIEYLERVMTFFDFRNQQRWHSIDTNDRMIEAVHEQIKVIALRIIDECESRSICHF